MDIDAISDHIQQQLRIRGMDEATAVEAARWLDDASEGLDLATGQTSERPPPYWPDHRAAPGGQQSLVHRQEEMSQTDEHLQEASNR